jgi:hypothetical protein
MLKVLLTKGILKVISGCFFYGNSLQISGIANLLLCVSIMFLLCIEQQLIAFEIPVEAY